MMRQLAIILSFTFALGLLSGPATSVAIAKKKRVVVTPFGGPGGAAARAGLIRGIKRRAKIISLKKFKSAADNLGLDASEAKGRSTIAAHLKLNAIIEGRVKRVKRRRYSVTVIVYDGRTGDELGQRTVKARSRRKLRRAGARAAKRIAPLLRDAQVGKITAPPPPPPPPPAPTPEAEDDDAQAKAEAEAMRKKKEDARLSAEAESGARPRGLVQISAAFGMATRSYKLEAQTAANNREYDGGLYPEVTIALETYPLLLMTRGALSGLGLGVSFAHHLSISTEQEATGNAVDSSSMELLFDLRYRWLFSDRASGPVVYGLAGFGMRSFDLADNDTLTPFAYQFLNIAVGGRMPLGTELLALEAEFSLKPILKAGQEAVDAFGERSGGLGLGIRAGLSGRLAMGLFYFATFEYLTFPSDFDGLTSKVRNVELAEASSGSDTFIRFWTGVGYEL